MEDDGTTAAGAARVRQSGEEGLVQMRRGDLDCLGDRLFGEAFAGEASGKPADGRLLREVAEAAHGVFGGFVRVGVFVSVAEQGGDDLFDEGRLETAASECGGECSGTDRTCLQFLLRDAGCGGFIVEQAVRGEFIQDRFEFLGACGVGRDPGDQSLAACRRP